MPQDDITYTQIILINSVETDIYAQCVQYMKYSSLVIARNYSFFRDNVEFYTFANFYHKLCSRISYTIGVTINAFYQVRIILYLKCMR